MAIRKRGSVWYADFVVNGKRYRPCLETGDRREALNREKDFVSLATAGKLACHSTPFVRLTFAEAVEIYLEDRKPRLRPKTIQTEKERARIVTTKLGPLPLKKITPEILLGYISERKQKGKANGTVNRELDIIRGVLRRARLWALLSEDVRPLPVRSEFGRALSFDEKLRLEKIATERPEWQSARLAMTIALTTTMRASEIRNLRWRDIDLFEKTVTIHRSKTEAGERIIPLNKVALGAILELRERAKLTFGDTLEPDWFLFWREADLETPDPLRATTSWRRAWRNITRAIRCPKCGQLQKPGARCWQKKCGADISKFKSSTAGFRFHDLRHHAITELGEGGATDQTIMAIAGHVSRKMLERYSHPRQAAKRAAVELLAAQGHVTIMSQNAETAGGGYPQVIEKMVDERGFEPPASSLRTMRSPS